MQGVEELVNHLQRSGVLKTPRIRDAFSRVDRADFVPPESGEEAYVDRPLLIGKGQTISQPTTVAFMLEQLQVQAGDTVLDVGSGSRWTTALLALLTGDAGFVYGTELRSELVAFGKANIEAYNVDNARIMQAENELGLAREAPFSKILVSAAVEELPWELVQQLAPGGRMVIPVRGSLVRVEKDADSTISTEDFFGFSFVPLHGG